MPLPAGGGVHQEDLRDVHQEDLGDVDQEDLGDVDQEDASQDFHHADTFEIVQTNHN